MTAALEFTPKLRKVINLSVVDNADGLVFIENRLMASSEVDDAQAPHSKPGTVSYENAFVIGPAMDNAVAHPTYRGSIYSGGLRVHYSSDSTHGYRFTKARA